MCYLGLGVQVRASLGRQALRINIEQAIRGYRGIARGISLPQQSHAKRPIERGGERVPLNNQVVRTIGCLRPCEQWYVRQCEKYET